MTTRNARRYSNLQNEGGYGYNPYANVDDAYLMRAAQVRIARYGSERCRCCGAVYAIDAAASAALDHECAERTSAARGED